MAVDVKRDRNQDVITRTDEFTNIKNLREAFGDSAYRAVERYYFNTGYEAGFEIVSKWIKEGTTNKEKMLADPVEAAVGILKEYFTARGGAMPEMWQEANTVFMRTRKSEWCPTPEAKMKSGVTYQDVCTINRRAFVKGLVKVLEDFLPAVTINTYNAGSRMLKEPKDCVEAFQVISPVITEQA